MPGADFRPLRAAGSLILAERTGRTLLLERADGSGWSHPGGFAEPGETAEQTAIRELDEETGFPALLTDCLTSFSIGVGPDGPFLLEEDETAPLIYDLFVVTVREEFVPRLNQEHHGWIWAKVDDIGPHLHPGCALALTRILELGGPP